MIGTLQCVVLECPDPIELARFYQRILGGTVNKPDTRWTVDSSWATLHSAENALAFQQVPGYEPPQWPGTSGAQQFHLDIGVPDLNVGEHAVVTAGAVLLNATHQSWRVFADPAGHPFCLVLEP